MEIFLESRPSRVTSSQQQQPNQTRGTTISSGGHSAYRHPLAASSLMPTVEGAGGSAAGVVRKVNAYMPDGTGRDTYVSETSQKSWRKFRLWPLLHPSIDNSPGVSAAFSPSSLSSGGSLSSAHPSPTATNSSSSSPFVAPHIAAAAVASPATADTLVCTMVRGDRGGHSPTTHISSCSLPMLPQTTNPDCSSSKKQFTGLWSHLCRPETLPPEIRLSIVGRA